MQEEVKAPDRTFQSVWDTINILKGTKISTVDRRFSDCKKTVRSGFLSAQTSKLHTSPISQPPDRTLRNFLIRPTSFMLRRNVDRRIVGLWNQPVREDALTHTHEGAVITYEYNRNIKEQSMTIIVFLLLLISVRSYLPPAVFISKVIIIIIFWRRRRSSSKTRLRAAISNGLVTDQFIRITCLNFCHDCFLAV